MVKSISVLILFAAATSLFAQPSVSIEEILKKIEANYKMTSDAHATVALTQQKAGQGVKNFSMLYYRRDKDNAFMIAMTEPESEKGNGYLRVEDNFWMYRRNTRTFQHVNRDENIAGSDAKGDDFEYKDLTRKFTGVKDPAGKDSIGQEKLGQMPVYKFKVKAIINDVDYPHKTFWVRTDNFLLLKEEDFALSGTLMATAYYLKYTQINGKFVPVKQMFIDEFEKGNKTIMEITGISTDKLDDKIFTKAYLENLSK
ncbi:MAG: outer membrane lipoprotein-sorting protein [Chitinivibrionales bacterium]|nr:outer membrane lipoprotein-sorting protein [Chitinivibrionales bacterium]